MQPSDGFWEGIGQSVGNSPGWMVIGAILVLGVLFVVAKYVIPSRERLKTREFDIREKEAQNDADRIKANVALAENMQGLRESNEALARQSSALASGIEESKVRSRTMNDEVIHIRTTTDESARKVEKTADQVDEIHKYLFRDGTD